MLHFRLQGNLYGKSNSIDWKKICLQFLKKLAGIVAIMTLGLCFGSTMASAAENVQFVKWDDAVISSRTTEETVDGLNNREPSYLRRIIITEGADKNDIKYTKVEISDIIESSGVLIHEVPIVSAVKISELPKITVKSQKEEGAKSSKSSKVSIIMMIAVVIILIMCILLSMLLFFKRKKKHIDVVVADNKRLESGEMTGGTQKSSMQSARLVAVGAKTLKLDGHVSKDALEMTKGLQGGNLEIPRQSFIVLSDVDNPDRNFRVVIDTRVVIGRGDADIVLSHDMSVSNKHCEIIKKGKLFYVNDLKSSNGTFYENLRVYHETPIISGGVLAIGRYRYKIMIEN